MSGRKLIDWTGVLFYGMSEVFSREGNLASCQQVRGSRGYQSQSDLRLHFGLGEHERVDSLEVAWPGGGRERFTDLAGDRFITVTEAQGLTASGAVH